LQIVKFLQAFTLTKNQSPRIQCTLTLARIGSITALVVKPKAR
jgi:hypothetical protein